jgi:hypothetical protein
LMIMPRSCGNSKHFLKFQIRLLSLISFKN